MKITGSPSNNEPRPEELPVLVLAYLGDAVYELLVRWRLVALGTARVDELHKETVKYVRADFQAAAIRRLVAGGGLTQAEEAVVRRGRNAKSAHPPKGAGPENYHYSTAFEALIGYLYLKGEYRRLEELMETVFAGSAG